MEENAFSIGILFNALVSSIVAGSAMALAVFLFKRYGRLNIIMRSYAWFWFFTVLVWITLSVRYALIGFGLASHWINYFDIALQIAVFGGGAPLVFYVGLRVFEDKKAAGILAIASIFSIVAAIWLILQPGGLVVQETTFFTSESIINTGSLIIFNVEGAIILFFLTYDTAMRLRRWHADHNEAKIFYEALYSLAIMIYLFLGIIEQSGLVTDWILVVFRILYAAAFLFVYVVITQYEAAGEIYLTEEKNIITI